jgi:FixJ family two-component response regulator
MASGATLFLVSSDHVFCGYLREALEGVAQSVQCFNEGRHFLDRFRPVSPGCILLESHLPDMDGVAVLDELNARRNKTPVIMMTTFNNVTSAVETMKHGVYDYMVKPIQEDVLVDRLRAALDFDHELDRERLVDERIAKQIAQLTEREKQVMDLLVSGLSNKGIAYELGISRKTVDIHRAHIMLKLGTDSLADLVRLGILSKLKNNSFFVLPAFV